MSCHLQLKSFGKMANGCVAFDIKTSGSYEFIPKLQYGIYIYIYMRLNFITECCS